MAKVKTIVLTGAEEKLTDLVGQNVVIKNLSAGSIYASAYPNIVAGADNVIEIPAGSGENLHDVHGTVYLLGVGKVQCTGTDYSTINFNLPSSSKGGGGGTGDVTKAYVDAQDETNLAAAKSYADSKIVTVSNPNLLDNWYFADPINQRGKTEYSASAGYTIDRWRRPGGSTAVIVQENCIRLERSIAYAGMLLSQISENIILKKGQSITFSVLYEDCELGENAKLYLRMYDHSSGLIHSIAFPHEEKSGLITGSYTASKDVSIRNVGIYISSSGETGVNVSLNLIAAKLEFGTTQTLAREDGDEWVLNDPPPNKALELAKCQRYYWESTHVFSFTSNDVKDNIRALVNVQFPVTMHARPAVTIISMKGKEGYLGDWSSTDDTNIAATVIPSATFTEGFGTINLENYHTTISNAFIFRVIADANL